MFTNFRPWMSIYQHVIHSAPRPGHAILDKFCANIQTQLPQGPIAGDLEVITCKNVSFADLLTLVLFITNGHWICHLVELLPWWSRYFVCKVRGHRTGISTKSTGLESCALLPLLLFPNQVVSNKWLLRRSFRLHHPQVWWIVMGHYTWLRDVLLAILQGQCLHENVAFSSYCNDLSSFWIFEKIIVQSSIPDQLPLNGYLWYNI